jgi:glycosyltransferase involved in cell wall biosynthesis
MISKLSTFWLNVGMIDRDMELSLRKQILQALADQSVEVRTNFNYTTKAPVVKGIDKIFFIKHRGNGLIGSIWLTIEQQMTFMKNIDVDVVVVRPFNLIETLPLWFFWRKVLRNKFPRFVLDIRSLVADDPGFLKQIQRQVRFWFSVRFAFRYFDGMTMITEKMKSDLQQTTRNFSKRICVWSSGMDPVLFNPDNVSDLREELQLTERFIIMYHGVFSFKRGLQEAIQAIDIVRKTHPEILLFLLGKGVAQSELEGLVQKLGLQDHVIIHPAVAFEQVPRFIKSANAGILPFPDLDSWNTSSPIKLTEYLAMGKPVIVTDIEAHRAALGNLKSGFFIPDHQPENIANGIRAVIEKKSDLDSLEALGRKTALENFTLEMQAKKIKTYFQDLKQEALISRPRKP